jgi:hypothetical protein
VLGGHIDLFVTTASPPGQRPLSSASSIRLSGDGSFCIGSCCCDRWSRESKKSRELESGTSFQVENHSRPRAQVLCAEEVGWPSGNPLSWEQAGLRGLSVSRQPCLFPLAPACVSGGRQVLGWGAV